MFFQVILLFFIITEMGVNTYFQVEGIREDWNFPSRSGYQQNMTEIDNLVNIGKSRNNQFYRTELTHPQTGNDSMKYNVNGISQFSSVRNRNSSQTLNSLGFKSEGTNLNLRYQNNTILADSLFAVSQNISPGNPGKFGFQHLSSQNGISLYENTYAAQLGILTEGVYKDVKFGSLTLDNQTAFLNQLTGLQHRYYTTLQARSTSQSTLFNRNRVIVTSKKEGKSASITYSVTIPAQSQVYISLPDIIFTNQDQEIVEIQTPTGVYTYSIDDAFSFFSAGFYHEDATVDITIHFPENETVSFDPPTFYRLDLEKYSEAMKVLQDKEIQTQVTGNTVKTTYKADKDSSILYTIPYDKGWSATVNGQPVPISQAQNGLMKVNVKEGEGEVVLTFVPHGFKLGSLLSVTGLGLFVLYHYFFYIRKRKKAAD